MRARVEAGLCVRQSCTDLHALRRREGMGEPAFPPQGVGMPVCFLGGAEVRRLKRRGTQRLASSDWSAARRVASLCSADGRGGRSHMSCSTACKQQVPRPPSADFGMTKTIWTRRTCLVLYPASIFLGGRQLPGKRRRLRRLCRSW